MFERLVVRLPLTALLWTLALSGPVAAATPFDDAQAVWHMADLNDSAGKNGLKAVGNVAVGKELQGKDFSSKERPLLPPRPDLYQEKYRPQFHVTARQWTIHRLNPGQREEGWINDVNGLIYHKGQYHLFAQRWARCWLHFVSKDLVHWTELQPAFWDDNRFGTGVQSGTIVFDSRNVSGLSPDAKKPPLVAFWSGFDNRSQCISYSVDDGLTWTKYAKNPYMIHAERDPDVFWYEPGRHWVLVLTGGGAYHFFTSRNLLDWTKQNTLLPDSHECPNVFPLPVDGDLKRQKWVVVRGNGRYSIGDFDGAKFTPQTGQLPCDFGPNFYATQSWGDIAGQPGRCVQIAWMAGGKYPGMPFNQQLTFPCDLTLRDRNGSLRIFRKPAGEIERLHGAKHALKDILLKPGAPRTLEASGGRFTSWPRSTSPRVRNWPFEFGVHPW